LLPVRDLADGPGPLLANRRRRQAEVLPELAVGEGGLRGRGEGRRAGERRGARVGRGGGGRRRELPDFRHASAPAARISARCMTRIGEPRRDSKPPRGMKHDVSDEVTTYAPVAE